MPEKSHDLQPWCPGCGTDEFLRYVAWQPPYTETRRSSTAGEVISRRHPVGGVITYTCQKCGYFNRHNVPDGWSPTVVG